MTQVSDYIEALRIGTESESYAVAMQRIYERWLKQGEWQARREVLPLATGVDPDCWAAYLNDFRLAAAEQELWRLFAAANDTQSEGALISVHSAYEWFRSEGVALPACFTRLYDFIRQTTFQSESAAAVENIAAEDHSLQHLAEREIVLGAALSLLSREPERCRDDNGFADGQAISKLILETAVRWFPSQAPSMTGAEMAALIDKWLE